MYIIEKFILWLNKKNSEENDSQPVPQNDDESLNCEHQFMPIDSSCEVLSCIKCGFVVKKRL